MEPEMVIAIQSNMSPSPMTSAALIPVMVPDMRPSADAVALSRNPRPDVPLPMPPSTSQAGVVSSAVVATTPEVRRSGSALMPTVQETERTLKPYGVYMLPRQTTESQVPAPAEG
jgi:hypothetical protein